MRQIGSVLDEGVRLSSTRGQGAPFLRIEQLHSFPTDATLTRGRMK